MLKLNSVDNTNSNQKEGYIYVLSNEMYKQYGNNVYKIGRSVDAERRTSSYCTYYIDSCVVNYTSDKVSNHVLIERLVHDKLDAYRIKKNREFFKCELPFIIDTINNVIKNVELNSTDYFTIIQNNTDIYNFQTKFKLSCENNELAQLYVKCIKGKHVITNDRHLSGYKWDEHTLLWTEASSLVFRKELGDVLANYIIEHTRVFELDSKKELEKLKEKGVKEEIINKEIEINKIKIHLNSVKNYVQSTNGQKNIFTQGSILLLNSLFKDSLNAKSDELPIKGKLVINLKTGETRERTVNDLWDYECPVNYLGKDTDLSIAWNFMLDITRVKDATNNREQLAKYLCKLIGYYLTKETSDQSFYIFYGRKGRNGKSTLMSILRDILVVGKGYVQCGPDVVLKNTKRSGATPELIPLQQARLAIISEPKKDSNDQTMLDVERIKELTGEDLMYARDLYGGADSFVPKCKIGLLCNNLPIGDSNDDAYNRRVKAMEFCNYFADTPQNKRKKDELMSNLDQFFTLFVNYGMEWWKTFDLSMPEEYTSSTQNYIQETNILQQFINEKIEENVLTFDTNGTIQSSVIYSMYKHWLHSTNPSIKVNPKEFKENMRKMYTFKETNKYNVFIGICLKKV